MIRILLLLGLAAVSASGAPELLGIVNAASYTPLGFPNSGIARGSIFVVFGRELGPTDLRSADTFPLTTNLGGTSVRVTVGMTTVDALMIYTLASQVAAILPSATPEGIGFVQVTYNGRTSEAGAALCEVRRECSRRISREAVRRSRKTSTQCPTSPAIPSRSPRVQDR